MVDFDQVKAASAAFPKPDNFHPSYGTAGFRARADVLASTVFRCGLIAAARALLLNAHTGIMITASHNPVDDNGVKMVDPDGGMMPQDFEPVAAELANCRDDDSVVAVLRDRVLAGRVFKPSTEADPATGSRRPHLTVLVGHDTRPSAPQLLTAALDGIRALGVHAHSCGAVTTPQLHFLVHDANHGPAASADRPPAPQLQTYFDTLLGAFTQLATRSSPAPADDSRTVEVSGNADGAPGSTLYVDCANGVGAEHLPQLAPVLRSAMGVELRLLNTGSGGGGKLNHRCGADFVQKDRLPPMGFDEVPAGARCCSVDGDADRLVYFSPLPSGVSAAAGEEQQHQQQQQQQQHQQPAGGVVAAGASLGGISLLDGDKVAMLAAVFIRGLMNQLPRDLLEGTQVCCVQTAYANGAATAHLRDVLQLPTVCTPTGVKYLHEAAHDADLGIYFESNGHGTVLFSQRLRDKLRQASDSYPAARELLLLSQLINQTVGDAISGILLVELILKRKGWTLADWQGLYSDLPSRQLKLTVADRGVITTTDAERQCVTPPGLQAAIDEAVAQVPQGRAFARPSGTEDAVRVYAEATTQEQADELARRVAQLVYDKAGGVGNRP